MDIPDSIISLTISRVVLFADSPAAFSAFMALLSAAVFSYRGLNVTVPDEVLLTSKDMFCPALNAMLPCSFADTTILFPRLICAVPLPSAVVPTDTTLPCIVCPVLKVISFA